MRRREVVAGLTLIVAWSGARAQQVSKLPRIGFLGAISASRYAAKWTRSYNNTVIEFRWAEGDYDGLPELAAEFDRLKSTSSSLMARRGHLRPRLQ